MEEKTRFELEIPIHSSPQMLYQYFSTASGLAEWFADNVNSRGEFFTFIWDDVEETARICSKISDEKVRFYWVNENKKDTKYYFEFKIDEDEITKDVSIIIVDFAETDEIEAAKSLWINQITELKHIIGSV